MVRVRVVDLETEQARQQLRARIGRLRRRIDARLVSVRDETRELASWRTCVRRYPVPALLAALMGGWLLASGLGRERWIGFIGSKLSGLFLGQLVGRVWKSWLEFWLAAPAGDGNDHA